MFIILIFPYNEKQIFRGGTYPASKHHTHTKQKKTRTLQCRNTVKSKNFRMSRMWKIKKSTAITKIKKPFSLREINRPSWRVRWTRSRSFRRRRFDANGSTPTFRRVVSSTPYVSTRGQFGATFFFSSFHLFVK